MNFDSGWKIWRSGARLPNSVRFGLGYFLVEYPILGPINFSQSKTPYKITNQHHSTIITSQQSLL